MECHYALRRNPKCHIFIVMIVAVVPNVVAPKMSITKFQKNKENNNPTDLVSLWPFQPLKVKIIQLFKR